MHKVAAARASESASILRAQILKGSSLALYVATPALASLALFSVYHAQGNTLRLETIFSSLSLIHVVRLSIGKNFARAAGVYCLPSTTVCPQLLFALDYCLP